MGFEKNKKLIIDFGNEPTSETFVKETFELTLNENGTDLDGEITITKTILDKNGKADKIHGTRTYRKEQ